MGDCEEGACRACLIGRDCSLEGGAGGNSGSEMLELSPNGPSGPRESSMASNRVACAPTFLGVRGPLPPEDFGMVDAESELLCGWAAFVSKPANIKALGGR